MIVDDATGRAYVRAQATVRFYRERYDPGERRMTAMIDLLADLMLYAERAGYHWDDVVRVAELHVNAERAGE
jgi:hypothetical protein